MKLIAISDWQEVNHRSFQRTLNNGKILLYYEEDPRESNWVVAIESGTPTKFFDLPTSSPIIAQKLADKILQENHNIIIPSKRTLHFL